MIREMLNKAIKDAVSALALDVGEIHLEHPTDMSHGDYSTNVAMILAKQTGKNPKELAQEIVNKIGDIKPKEVKKVEVAEPGFINFHLSRDFFAESINKILKDGEKWGSNKLQSGKKVMVEYTDPNPFKEFHIGHLMSNAIGESISRIIEFSDAEVKRANYQGDVGLHVALTIWYKKKNPNCSWEQAYAEGYEIAKPFYRGGEVFGDSAGIKKKIDEINKMIYEKTDPEINKIYEKGRTLSLKHFEEIYKKLGTKFDYYFFESDTGKVGKELIENNKNIFEESDGAIIFKGEKYGFHTRVFINSEGLPTYEAKDLGLAKIKDDKYHYDQSIIVTGNEVQEYFKVVLGAMEQIFPDLAQKTKNIPHGMLRLPSGKMSSRTGDVVTAESLIDEVKNRVLDKMKDSEIKNKEDIAEKVAVGAIKYSILKQSAGKDIIFDFDKSLSFEGDSGPYLQYSHTRAGSVLDKAEVDDVKPDTKVVMKKITGLERLLYRFPEVVERAGKEFEPHYITTYLTELAGAFNNFYGKERIVEKSETASYKVALTEAFANTIKNGLSLLGIEVPYRM